MQCNDANPNVCCHDFTLNTTDCLIVFNNISELNTKLDLLLLICISTNYPVASYILLTAALCHSLPEIPPLTHQPWSLGAEFKISDRHPVIFPLLSSLPLFKTLKRGRDIYLDFFRLILRKMRIRSSSLVESIHISISWLFCFEFTYLLCKTALPPWWAENRYIKVCLWIIKFLFYNI